MDLHEKFSPIACEPIKSKGHLDGNDKLRRCCHLLQTSWCSLHIESSEADVLNSLQRGRSQFTCAMQTPLSRMSPSSSVMSTLPECDTFGASTCTIGENVKSKKSFLDLDAFKLGRFGYEGRIGTRHWAEIRNMRHLEKAATAGHSQVKCIACTKWLQHGQTNEQQVYKERKAEERL